MSYRKNSENKKMIEAIRHGKDLEVYLPQFGKKLAESYYQVSLFDFAMNYVVAYESVMDSETGLGLNASEEGQEGELYEYLTAIRQEVERGLLADFDGQRREQDLERLDELRKSIIRRMDVLTAYVDKLEIYEYILNRLKPQFLNDAQNLTKISEDELEEIVNNLYEYIFDSKDNMVINGKIQEILGQLPVRMAKQKFYSLLKESFTIYQGSDCSSLELYDYMIRTGGMLYQPEGISEYYGELRQITEMLAGMDFEHLTKEEYEAAKAALERGTEFIKDTTGIFLTLALAINNLYVLMLTAPYVPQDFAGRKQAEKIIRVTNDAFNGVYPAESDYMDTVDTELDFLPGRVERQLAENEELEAALIDTRQYEQLIDSLMLRPLYESLYLCIFLRSGSIFADMEQKPEVDVTEDLLESMTEKLIEDFAAAFAEQKRPLRRAVMASVLSRMPVFFTGQQEVVDYIENALYGCTNLAELIGSVGILRGIYDQGNDYD